MLKLFEQYVNLNNESTRKKLLEFEDLRKKESTLKQYYTLLQELDRDQFENGFYKFSSQFNKMINYLSDFDPNYIKHEFSKIEEYKSFVLRYKSEFLNISQKLSFIHNKWDKFLNRNEFLRNSHLDHYFIKEYTNVWDIIESSKTSELSSTEYAISKFSEDIESIILAIEKIGIYLNQYIFIGEEALKIKGNLEEYLNVNKINSKEEFLNNIQKIFIDIENMVESATYGVVGLRVFKAHSISSPDIYKYTVEIGSNNYLEYDSFFKSDGMQYNDTGMYIYFEDFPKKGVFKGRKVCENLSLDHKYIKIISTIKKKFSFLLNITLFSGILLSIFSILASSLIMGIGILAMLIIFYLSIDHLFNFYTSKFEGIYKDLFYLVKLDFGIIELGNDFEPKYLMNGMIENFDDVFVTNNNGGKKWIKEYQSQKNQ